MRDNSLARGLIARGHEAHLVPMYLPLQLDEERADESAPVFFGGINVYLQQKYRFFRSLPRWIDRAFNGRGLLRRVAKRSHLTSAKEQGEMTCLMLRLEESNLGKEVDKLIDCLRWKGKLPPMMSARPGYAAAFMTFSPWLRWFVVGLRLRPFFSARRQPKTSKPAFVCVSEPARLGC